MYTDTTAYSNAHFGESSGPYHLDNVYCNGYEANLTACSRRYTTGGVYNNGIGVHNCAPGKEAGVKCDSTCVACVFVCVCVCVCVLKLHRTTNYCFHTVILLSLLACYMAEVSGSVWAICCIV